MTASVARGSIRRRLFVQLAGIAALLSVAMFLVVRGVAETAAEKTQDDILGASATSIADALRSESGEITLDLPYSALSMLGTINDDRVFYRVVVDGVTLTGYSDLPMPVAGPGLTRSAFSTFDFRGDEVRMVSVGRKVSVGGVPANVLISVAQTRLGLASISRRIGWIATIFGLGFFLVATALSLMAARSALLPLERLTDSVTRRGPSDLRPLVLDTPTELAPFVDALNRFIERLRASLQRSEDLIAEAAHRVRTPLATVRTRAEVTHRKLMKPEHKEAMREMIRAIDESSRSAGQLLDHAMITFRADSLADESIDLSLLVRETCERISPTAELKDIQLRLEAPQSGQIMLQGDQVLLQSAVRNLLDNAIKYSPGDTAIDIRLEACPEIVLSIADAGRGFGNADTRDLKKRFTRGANVDDVVGSGLGLTIADEVARAHGGRLDIAANHTGVGTCVSLVFPAG